MKSIKQVIVVRKDLNMRKGKIAAQACHASLYAILRAMLNLECFSWNYNEEKNKIEFKSETEDRGENLEQWFNKDYKKIVLYVNSKEELLNLKQIADNMGVICSLITDNDNTESHGVPTITCLAFEPLPDECINIITGHLPLL